MASAFSIFGGGIFVLALVFSFCPVSSGESLSCRGWPTSLVLLLRVEVSEFSLALGGHASLGLHHLLGVVGAARGLVVSLRGVKVLQVGARRATGILKVVDRVGSRALAVGSAACYDRR